MKTSIDNYIETVHFESASEFLDYLQPRNTRWLPKYADTTPWVFRGQRRSEWKLVPSAMRTEWFDEFKEKMYETALHLTIEQQSIAKYKADEFQPELNRLCELILQQAAEWHAVDEFIQLADQVGHQIPEDKRWGTGVFSIESVVQDVVSTKGIDRQYAYIPAGIDFSLAQHHGIPTRALDWTASPFVAAFFAAEEVAKTEGSHEYDMAIWAFRYTVLDNSDNDLKESNLDLKYFTQRRAKINYLHAQSGIFIYDSKANLFFLKNGTWRSFEDALEGFSNLFNSVILRKITLPSSQANELLRLLSAENVTRAHIMPTLDNVIETLKLRRRLIK